MCFAVGLLQVADSVINDQPSVPRENGRSAAADLEPLPGRHRGGQPVMRGELVESVMLRPLEGGCAVGDPDAFPVDIQRTGCRPVGRFLWTGTREKRSVQKRQFRNFRWIGNGD